MWTEKSMLICMRIAVIFVFAWVSGCGAMQHGPEETDDFFADTNDPFEDPFFTDPPEWDKTMLAHREVLSQTDFEGETGEESGESESAWEQTEGILFSTILVAASRGKLALIPLGLGF
jgi:hypothetical protein